MLSKQIQKHQFHPPGRRIRSDGGKKSFIRSKASSYLWKNWVWDSVGARRGTQHRQKTMERREKGRKTASFGLAWHVLRAWDFGLHLGRRVWTFFKWASICDLSPKIYNKWCWNGPKPFLLYLLMKETNFLKTKLKSALNMRLIQ